MSKIRRNNKTPYKWWTPEEEKKLVEIVEKHRRLQSTILSDARKAFPERSESSITNKISSMDGRKY